ncbi:MAG: TIGR00282 family metallophosphoesterase [Clostridia bacterium]|nr:TIGR00282 family metallophosphoesterase [Clostridia bacterium]
MKILAVGDVVGPLGLEYLSKNLRNYISKEHIDLTLVNGENASVGNGLCRADAEAILEAGADVITGGNHIWQKKDLRDFLYTRQRIIRPCNYPGQNSGSGYTIAEARGYRVLVINVMGIVFSEPLDCPFNAVERVLKREEGNYDFAVLDIHAETTSEKYALARYFDGRINCIYGTHTHIPTADEQILPLGSGYITDIGMTGAHDGILGVKTECIIHKLTTKLPTRFELAENDVRLNGVLFCLNTSTGKVEKIERVTLS